jgi:hypothetical protein
MIRKMGFPSAVFCAPVEISIPFTSRPSTLLWFRVTVRVSDGYRIASRFSSRS